MLKQFSFLIPCTLISHDFHSRVLCQVIRPLTSGAEQKQAAPACNVTSNITCNRGRSSTVPPSPAGFSQPCPTAHSITSRGSPQGLHYTLLAQAVKLPHSPRSLCSNHPTSTAKPGASEASPGPSLWVRWLWCTWQHECTTLKSPFPQIMSAASILRQESRIMTDLTKRPLNPQIS